MNNKPLILEIEEAKTEIIQAINNAIRVHNLPCYIVDMILTELRAQVKEGSREELAVAREQVKQQEEKMKQGVAEATSS
jgi:hypothetical protein